MIKVGTKLEIEGGVIEVLATHQKGFFVKFVNASMKNSFFLSTFQVKDLKIIEPDIFVWILEDVKKGIKTCFLENPICYIMGDEVLKKYKLTEVKNENHEKHSAGRYIYS